MVLREREDLLPALALGFTGFYWILLAFTGFYWLLLDFTGFFMVLREREDLLPASAQGSQPYPLTFSTGFYWLLLASTGLYWLLLSFTGFYWAFLVLRGRKDVLLPARAQGSQPRPLW